MKDMTGFRLLIVLLVIVLNSGCTTSQSAQLGKGAAGYGLRNSKGETMTLTHKPQRIVSLGIAMDEILVELVPPDRIAALTYLADDVKISNITEQAKQVPNRVIANAEIIAYLKPDLVLAADWHQVELIQIMRDAGIPVYIFKAPRSIKQIQATVMDIARLVSEVEAGTRIVANMDAELASIAARVDQIPEAQRKVVMRYGTMGVSGGKGSSFDDICQYAGVKNGAAIAGLGTNGQLSKEQIVQINPDIFLLPVWDPQAYLYRGQAYLETKQYDAALADYSSVISLDSQYADAYFRRGVCYYYKDQYETAIGELDEALRLNPKHAGSYLVKGVCYQKLERKEEAIAAYNKSLLANVPDQEKEAVSEAKKMLKSLEE